MKKTFFSPSLSKEFGARDIRTVDCLDGEWGWMLMTILLPIGAVLLLVGAAGGKNKLQNLLLIRKFVRKMKGKKPQTVNGQILVKATNL